METLIKPGPGNIGLNKPGPGKIGLNKPGPGKIGLIKPGPGKVELNKPGQNRSLCPRFNYFFKCLVKLTFLIKILLNFLLVLCFVMPTGRKCTGKSFNG